MRRKASGLYKSAVEQQPCETSVTCVIQVCVVKKTFLVDNLPLLLECHQLQSMVLYRDNMELGRTNDKLAEAYAMQGR